MEREEYQIMTYGCTVCPDCENAVREQIKKYRRRPVRWASNEKENRHVLDQRSGRTLCELAKEIKSLI